MNDRLTLGASLDYVWATLDMAMATSTQRLGGMVTGGTLAGQVPGMMGMNGGATAGRIAFSDTNDFTGAASSTGWGSKVGLTLRAERPRFASARATTPKPSFLTWKQEPQRQVSP